MLDTLLDDINELLLNDVGDERILQQIKRALMNHEVVSVNERNYIKNLKNEYLASKPESEPESDFISFAGQTLPQSSTHKIVPIQSPVPPPLLLQKRGYQKHKRKIGIIGIMIVLVAILSAGVLFSGVVDLGSSTPKTFGSLLSTDETSYMQGDIISISGRFDVSLGDEVTILVENTDGSLIWTENINLKSNGCTFYIDTSWWFRMGWCWNIYHNCRTFRSNSKY